MSLTEIAAAVSVVISLLSLVLSRRKAEAEAENFTASAVNEIAKASVSLIGPSSERMALLERRVSELEGLRLRDRRIIRALRVELRKARARIKELEERLRSGG